jgi:hypothetical protein
MLSTLKVRAVPVRSYAMSRARPGHYQAAVVEADEKSDDVISFRHRQAE